MNGKILRNNLSGKCDSIHFNQMTGIAQLINKENIINNNRSRKTKRPILWNNRSQITGDSIHIKFNNENDIRSNVENNKLLYSYKLINNTIHLIFINEELPINEYVINTYFPLLVQYDITNYSDYLQQKPKITNSITNNIDTNILNKFINIKP